MIAVAWLILFHIAARKARKIMLYVKCDGEFTPINNAAASPYYVCQECGYLCDRSLMTGPLKADGHFTLNPEWKEFSKSFLGRVFCLTADADWG